MATFLQGKWILFIVPCLLPAPLTAAQQGVSNDPIYFAPEGRPGGHLPSETYGWPLAAHGFRVPVHHYVPSPWLRVRLWKFVAYPMPPENQTEDTDRPHVATAILYGPTYEEGRGWTYGPAGTVLVPRAPPYAPFYRTPPRSGGQPPRNSGSATDVPQAPDVTVIPEEDTGDGGKR